MMENKIIVTICDLDPYEKLAEMNGKMIVSKPIYVALAQRKEKRKARLQFQQMRPMAMAPSMMAPRMPMYPPGFYGQGPPAMIPQAGFGYLLVPGMRPSGGPMPNFFVPVVQQGQQGQRPGGRRGSGPVQHNQQPVPMMLPQMVPRGRMYRYPGRNVADGNMGGGMHHVPYDNWYCKAKLSYEAYDSIQFVTSMIELNF